MYHKTSLCLGWLSTWFIRRGDQINFQPLVAGMKTLWYVEKMMTWPQILFTQQIYHSLWTVTQEITWQMRSFQSQPQLIHNFQQDDKREVKKDNANPIYFPTCVQRVCIFHYDDVIMDAIASLITNLTIVYSTVNSDADRRKHQSSASLAFVWGFHRGTVDSPHKWPVTLKMFPFDDVIMITHIIFRLAEVVFGRLNKNILIKTYFDESTRLHVIT